MSILPITIKPIVEKEDVEYFWKQAESSGRPSKKAVEKLKNFKSQRKSLAKKK